jgi:hypothetical protein
MDLGIKVWKGLVLSLLLTYSISEIFVSHLHILGLYLFGRFSSQRTNASTRGYSNGSIKLEIENPTWTL